MPKIAGYNPFNEPADPDHTNLIAFYELVEKAIRQVDHDHILFLDGNSYAVDFTRFTDILPNCVYAMHDYSSIGFPLGEPFEGRPEQTKKLRFSFERKVAFMRDNNVPVWNGEFGPVYASTTEPNHEMIDIQRCNLLQEQLKIYRESDVSWPIWLYKDIGYQGMVYVNPESPWMRLLAPFLAKKKFLGVDFWGRDDKDVQHIYKPLLDHIEEAVPERFPKRRYPSPLWTVGRHAERVMREMLLSEYLNFEMAEYFEGKTFEELDAPAASFKFENCVQRAALISILQKDSERA